MQCPSSKLAQASRKISKSMYAYTREALMDMWFTIRPVLTSTHTP
jgi:hypothetical protein